MVLESRYTQIKVSVGLDSSESLEQRVCSQSFPIFEMVIFPPFSMHVCYILISVFNFSVNETSGFGVNPRTSI